MTYQLLTEVMTSIVEPFGERFYLIVDDRGNVCHRTSSGSEAKEVLTECNKSGRSFLEVYTHLRAKGSIRG